MTLFDLVNPSYEINKPIRLIETFAGYGSQAMALRNIGADFETYRMYEIDKYAVASYNAVHGTDFEPTDICDVKGIDLGIEDKEGFTYLLIHSHAQTYQSPDGWQEWQRTATQDHPCYGKSAGY